jgi:hypothetical protein
MRQAIVTVVVLIILVGIGLEIYFSKPKPESTKSTVKETTTTTTAGKKSEPVAQQQETRPISEPRRPEPPTDLPSISAPTPPATATPPATPAPVATPVAPVRPVVSNRDLIQDLGSTDVEIAYDSARRLIRRDDATFELTEAFASGDATLKTRTLWCLRRMGEPCRLWLNGVLENPDCWRPSLVTTVKDVLNALNGEFSPQPVNLPPEVTNDQIMAKIAELSEALGKRKIEYDQLMAEQSKLRKELTAAETRAETVARSFHTSHRRSEQDYVIQLKNTIDAWRGIAYVQSGQLSSLSEQIRRLSAEIEALKTRPYPPPAPTITPSCSRCR